MSATPTPLNGSKLIWWLVGTVSTLVLALSAGAMSNLRNHTERIAVLESRLSDTRLQLERIERKLDHLVDQCGKR
jgi:hypothetical protein